MIREVEVLSELTGRVVGVTVEYAGEERREGACIGVWSVREDIPESPFSISSTLLGEAHRNSKLSMMMETTRLRREACSKNN